MRRLWRLVVTLLSIASVVFLVYTLVPDQSTIRDFLDRMFSGGDPDVQATEPTTDDPADAETMPTTDDPADAEPLDPTVVQATASSELPPSAGLTYGPDNTIDGDLTTAWNEGAEGAGEGQWLEYRFDQPRAIVAVTIVNGYAKSDDVFHGNARVKAATIVTDQGSFAVELEDHPQEQTFSGSFGPTSHLRIVVDEVYPGSEWTDLAVTAVGFLVAAEDV